MPRSPSLDTLLRDNADDLALVIGNGVNRFGAAVNSWDRLLIEMARDCHLNLSAVPHGTALTEFYDVLELRSNASTSSLQARFCELMSQWRPLPHHVAIMSWAKRHHAPVLTTNFDEVLSTAADCEFLLPRNPKFTDFYPWEARFAEKLYSNPCDGFGIWHINGMARYKRSVRLGLSHYMGSVQRARTWLHRSGDARLFHGKDRTNWAGAGTWMHLVFNKPLLIFGLALEENEVFLRWLLIERAKYFREFPERRHPAWYVYTPDPKDERQAGKHFFLEALGFQCVEAPNFDGIYASRAWAT